jgi:transposase-like protein
LQRVIVEEGSIRRAARVLDVPRSTLSAWIRKVPCHEPARCEPAPCDGQQDEQNSQ